MTHFTRAEKRRFIRLICNDLRDALLRDVPRVPVEWDGLELREWIADRADRLRIKMGGQMYGKRRRNYHNAMRVANL